MPGRRLAGLLLALLATGAARSADDLYEALANTGREGTAPAAEASPSETGAVAPRLIEPSRRPQRVARARGERLPTPGTARRASRGPDAAAAVESLLGRDLEAITVDAAPSTRVAEQSRRIKPANQIRDLTAERFDEPPRYVTAADPAELGLGRGFAWAAPALYHRPLLLEEPNLERYGHRVALCDGDHLTQSLVSGAHFFGTVPVLPYLVGAYGCREPQYVLGAYRPGSCNPHRLVKPRDSWRGVFTQAAASTGVVLLVP